MTNLKCVIVVDPAQGTGAIANTAAILSMSLGKRFPDLIGDPLVDGDGDVHGGITTVPIPILAAQGEALRTLREILKGHEADLAVVDLIGATRSTRSYGEYAEHMRATPPDRMEYVGLAMCGPAKLVNRFSGSLALLR